MKFRQILGSIGNEFVYGGHLPALVAPAIISAILILLNKDFRWELLVIGYLIAFITYRYNYYKELERDSLTNPERVQHLRKTFEYSLGIIIIYFLICLTLVIIFTNLETILFTFFLVAMGICYTHGFKRITKEITGFKNIYISIPWSLFTVFISFSYSILFNWSLFIISLFIFLRVFLNTIFFDIKDIESDRKEGLKTFPTVYGKERTLKFLHILNFFSFTPLAVAFYLNFLPVFALTMLVFFFYSLYYFERVRGKNIVKQKLPYAMADAEFLFWPIVLFLGKIII